MPRRNLLSMAIGLGLLGLSAGLCWSQELGQQTPQNAASSTNQQLANHVSQALGQSPHVRQFHVSINVVGGEVQLVGQTTDPWVRQEIIGRVWTVPGVRRVNDQYLSVMSSPIQTVQALPEQGPAPMRVPASGMQQAPAPINGGGGMDSSGQPPRMPPYAWPSFAPYNNYSRVAYPNLYPYQAWPFIGPFYPFPKIPPGWRSVSLTWEDGCWWYGKGVTGHDWWRIRYH